MTDDIVFVIFIRQIFSRLREQGVVVRYFDKPRIDNHLRISIGTEEDNAALLTALELALS